MEHPDLEPGRGGRQPADQQQQQAVWWVVPLRQIERDREPVMCFTGEADEAQAGQATPGPRDQLPDLPTSKPDSPTSTQNVGTYAP